RKTSVSSTASGSSYAKVASIPDLDFTAAYWCGSPTSTILAWAARVISSRRTTSGVATMPASSTTTTVSRFHPNCATTWAGARSSVPYSARAIVEDSWATCSPTMRSAALPVGARPMTVLPACSHAWRAAFSDEVLPAPAGATTTEARKSELTTAVMASAWAGDNFPSTGTIESADTAL